MRLARGSIIIVKGLGDKTRPAVVVQSDAFMDAVGSVTVCPLTTHLIGRSRLRIDVPPSATNGLAENSQIMVDKLQTYMKNKVSDPIGELEPSILAHVDLALRSFLDLHFNGLEALVEVPQEK
jgi:mRNA interferase MazF